MVGRPPDRPETALGAEIAEAVSRLYLDKFGKGPLHAETFINGDVVTTVMRDVFTVAEKHMVAEGRSDSVLVTRMLWQQATMDSFKRAIEELTGRACLSVVSGFDVEADLATEVFLLA